MFSPPPYSNIAGIAKALNNYVDNVPLARYDGNAKPGELVVDLDTFTLYVGNDSGNLIPVGSGAGGVANAIQFNQNGALAGNSAFTYDEANSTVILQGTLDATSTAFVGDLVPNANITYSLGNSTNQWLDLWVSNNTIFLNSVPLSLSANNTLTIAGNPIVTTSNTTGDTNVTQMNVSGNLTAVDLSVIGNITAGRHYYGNGYYLTDIQANNVTDLNSYLANYSGPISANSLIVNGNLAGNYVLGNGAFLTGLPQPYSNANVAAYLASGTLVTPISTQSSVMANVIASNSSPIIIDPLHDGSPLTGTVEILGNLSVTGNLTYVNVNQATTGNLTFISAANATLPLQAAGGGLAVGNALAPYASFTYDPTGNTWLSNIAIATPSVTSGNTLVLTGADSLPVPDSIVSSGMGGLTIGTAATPATISVNAGATPTVKFTVAADVTPGVPNSGAVWVQGGLNVWRGMNVGGSANVTGNLAATYLYGNGAFLTGLPLGTSYSNVNAAAYFAGNANTAITVQGNIRGQYIFGNGAFLTGIPSGNGGNGGNYGDSNVITLLGNLGSNSVSTGGSVTANAFIGDGSQLTGLWGNANLADVGANAIGTTGSVTAGYFVGNGANLTGLYGNANLANIGTNSIVTTGSVTAGYLVGDGANLTGLFGNSNLGNIGANSISTTGSVAAAFFVGDGANITGLFGNTTLSNIGSNTITTSNAITAGWFVGDGANLTGLYGNSNVADYLPVYGGSITANTVVAGGISVWGNNITSDDATLVVDPSNDGSPLTGDLTVLGNLSVTGNVTYVGVSSATTANLQWISAINANTDIQASGGGLQVGPIGTPYASWIYSQPANAWTSNIGVSAAGNVTATAFIGDGGLLSNISASSITGAYSNANVAAYLPINTADLSANVTTLGNTTITGSLTTSNAVTFNLPNSATTDVRITSALAATFGTRIGTTASNQYSWRTNLFWNGTAWVKDDATRTGWRFAQICQTSNAASLISFGLSNIGTSSITDIMALYGNATMSVFGNVIAAANVRAGALHSNSLSSSSSTLLIDPLGDGSQTTGDVRVLGNLSVTGNLTYVDVSTSFTSNLVWAAAASGSSLTEVSGGGLTLGNAATPLVTWLYSEPANAWVSNVGVSAPSFTGDGGSLSNINGANIIGGYGDSDVSVYLASGNNTGGFYTAGNVVTTGQLGVSYDTSATGAVSFGDGVSGATITAVGSANTDYAGANSLNLITDSGTIGLYPSATRAMLVSDTELKLYNLINEAAVGYVVGYRNKTSQVTYSNALDLGGNITAAVMTDTRIQPRVTTVDPAPPILLPGSDSSDQWDILNALGAVTVSPDQGTPFHGQKWTWRFYSTTAYTLTWDVQYRPFGVTLPTEPAVNTNIYVGMIYNAIDAAWDVVSVATQTTPN